MSEVFHIWLYPKWQAANDAGEVEDGKLGVNTPFMTTPNITRAVMADLNCFSVTVIRDGQHVGVKASDPRDLARLGIVEW